VKIRLIVFVIVGFLFGICGGVITSAVSYIPVEPIPPAYLSLLLEGAAIWGMFGIVNGVLQFFMSIGETPIMMDKHTGRSFPNPEVFRGFDYRRMGAKLILIFLAWGLAAPFLMDWLLTPGNLAEPRLIFIRLGFSLFASLVCAVSVVTASMPILVSVARRR